MHDHILDALRRGAAAEALSAARDAVAADPQDATAQRLLGAALHLGGDREGALAALDAALELAPVDAAAHLARAGLLLDARRIPEAQAALGKSVEMDPNQFGAYVVQANLALGRGELGEAERIARTAARIAPGHPQLAAIEGMVMLRRGDADGALGLLSRAAQAAPDDGTVQNALGFAFLAKGHFAFAEQSFRRVQEQQPDSVPLRLLLANLLRRQGRPVEAADEVRGLAGPDATPVLLRTIGELELDAGRPQDALRVLREAFGKLPGDRATLAALATAWQLAGASDEARRTLDDALAVRPEDDTLWHARLAFEAFAGPEALAVVQRWLAMRPGHVPALMARLAIHDHAGEVDAADAIADQITALEPGHAQAEMRVVDSLLRRDPPAAIARVESLVARAPDPRVRRELRRTLGRCLDVAGDLDRAVTVWAEVAAEQAAERLPLPPQTATLPELPPLAEAPAGARRVLFLWGAPGALPGKVAVTVGGNRIRLLGDRFSAQPPVDPLQRYDTLRQLAAGTFDAGDLAAQWRETFRKRAGFGAVCEWLVWWDNALLPALRAHVPEGTLVFALRDPRDMLLDWLAWDALPPFGLASVEVAAQWLAQALGQIADVHGGNLYPHALVRLDGIEGDPAAVAAAIGDALGQPMAPAPADMLGVAHFPPGRWRAYAEPLREAFAALTPVAVRLGYPES